MVQRLFRSALSRPHAGTLPSAVRELCATRLHNRTPAHRFVLPISPVPAPLSSPLVSVRASPMAADVRGWTLGNMPYALTLEIAAPGTHRRTSASRPASTARRELHTDTFRARQTGCLSPPPCAAPRRGSHRFSRERTRLAADSAWAAWAGS